MNSNTFPNLKRVHAKRLRELYRSAGWPYQDVVEIELLAAGLLERVPDDKGVDCMRVTDAGLQYLAGAAQTNRDALSAHNTLVDKIARTMMDDGRIAWKGLQLRAPLPPTEDMERRWRTCIPDVFSIRNSTVQAYLEPIVHEIKVSRADLLGDLKNKDKRDAYLGIGGQCWYVLGCNAKAEPIGSAQEIPVEYGVMVYAQGRCRSCRFMCGWRWLGRRRLGWRCLICRKYQTLEGKKTGSMSAIEIRLSGRPSTVTVSLVPKNCKFSECTDVHPASSNTIFTCLAKGPDGELS